VFAVYMPPQAPAPGMAFFIISLNSSSEMTPAIFCPSASKAETMFNFFPLYLPEAMVPPYTINDGRFKRNIAIMAPGIFLSQPTTVTKAS